MIANGDISERRNASLPR